MQKRSPSLVDKETHTPLHYIYIWEINIVICGLRASGGSDGKETACNVGDLGSIPG